jgi:pimeloyl-ACP methyl ester carboxylesterase
MFFVKQGLSGPTIILIHGLGASSFSWRETATVLSSRFITFAVDLLGFGKSSAPSLFAFTAKAQADAVATFVGANSLPPPLILIGHSMGGAVCLYLAQKPIAASLSKMVLIAPVASPPTSAGASGLAALSASAQAPSFDRFLAEQVLRVAYAKPARITPQQINGYADGLSSATQKEAFFKHSASLGEISFAPTEFSRISVKTFIVWGKDDKFLEQPPRGGQRFAPGLVVVIQGVDLGRPDRRGCRRSGLCAKPIHHHHRDDSEGRDGQVDVEVGTHSKNR